MTCTEPDKAAGMLLLCQMFARGRCVMEKWYGLSDHLVSTGDCNSTTERRGQTTECTQAGNLNV